MPKRYLLIEEDDTSFEGCLTLCIGIGALLAIVYIILAYAHFLLGALLGFLGFLAGKHIIDANPIYKKRHKSGVYLVTMLALGAFGFWVGTQVSTKFRKDIESPPEKRQPAQVRLDTNQQEVRRAPAIRQKTDETTKRQDTTESTESGPKDEYKSRPPEQIQQPEPNTYQAPPVNQDSQTPDLNLETP